MCGICGIVKRDSSQSVSEQQILSMNNQMVHRGPDADGIYVKNNLALGHRRLKIIDLEGGIQPMFNDDASVVIVFNGEVYNFNEIRKTLEEKGYHFKTHSDTEVILNAYLEYGERCVEFFRGMFGIAIFDHRNNKLLLLRDRVGIKPIYYYLDDEQLVFASEIKPILTMLGEKPKVHTPSLDFYMSVGYVPGEDTLFHHIKKLKPGHSLTLVDNQVHIREYWDLENSPMLDLSFDQACEQFEHILDESIRLRMVSDVPLGAFLSGGLDSSTIVSSMSQLSNSPVKTFSVGYKDDPKSNELGYAKIVADHFKTEHHEYILEPLDFFDSLEILLEYTEEPIVESAAVALYQLSKLAKEHVTVILSGEGGDEILAGYPLHQITNKVDKLHRFARFIPGFFADAASGLMGGDEKKLKYWDWINTPVEARYQSISQDVTRSVKKRMYQNPQLEEAAQQTQAYYQALYQKQTQATPLRKMAYSDIKSWLPDDLLVKADKMTMAASLELRVPMLDHKLMEFATALPDHYRLNNGQGKYLLKKLMEKHLPHEIIYRKKQGFPVPIATWFRTSLYEKTREILLDDKTLSRGYFKPGYIESVLARHKSGKEDLSRRIFSLLNLELWHRKYID